MPLESPRSLLEAFWRPLEAFSGSLCGPGGVFKRLGCLGDPLGASWGVSWEPLEGLLGPSRGHLGAILAPLGASWAPLGAILEAIDQGRGVPGGVPGASRGGSWGPFGGVQVKLT